ncbi:MAG TPA: CHRD domain-containing protein [Burkholderiales bacterium]|nr:CHRD domain-containing protein [Burkholderiales bacterium]
MTKSLPLFVTTLLAFAAMPAAADEKVSAILVGYNEVPSISTAASGSFRAEISRDGQFIDYELSYRGLEGDVQQAHIHLGQKHTLGGVSAFLCRTTQTVVAPTCPPSTATGVTVSGTIRSSEVVGPAGQLLAPGEIAELIAAIRAGAAYANVHTSAVPSGEIRGQIRRGNRGRHDRDD